MTGKIFISKEKFKKILKTSFYFESEMNKKHNHFIIQFNNKVNLIYNDVRKFGFIKLIFPNQQHINKHLQNLGPEPLNSEFNSGLSNQSFL